MERFQTHKKILIGFLNMTIVASIGVMLLMSSPSDQADAGKPAQLFDGGLSLGGTRGGSTTKSDDDKSTPEPTPTPAQEVAVAPTVAPVPPSGGGGVGPAVPVARSVARPAAPAGRSPGNSQAPATSNRTEGLNNNIKVAPLLQTPRQTTNALLKKVDQLIGR